jgi:hypothetical protein
LVAPFLPELVQHEHFIDSFKEIISAPSVVVSFLCLQFRLEIFTSS